MNTTENNRLLAEFLGWSKGTYQRKVTNPKHPEFKRKQPIKEVYLLEDSHPIVENIYTDLPGFYWDYDKEDENGNTVNRLKFFPEDLKFHNDWNWLMLVVEKIESLGNHGLTIYRKSTNINGLPIEIANNRADSKIEATYNACIEFVKWWNKEQLKNNIMNLAEQLQSELNFNKIVSQLQREFGQGKTSVFISSNLATNNVQRLRDEGFQVNNEGEWRNGGVYVSFKPKNQWSDR